MVEFALLSIVVLPLLVGIIYFGIAFNNQITLTNAVNSAAQAVVSGGGPNTDPCSLADNALYLAAGSLNNKNIYGSNPLSFSISVYTNATTSYPSGPYQVFSSSGGPSSSASCTGEAQYFTPAQPVSVTATYGCSLSIYGVNYFHSCVLTATSSGVFQ
jgi:hypothetical protein